MKKILFFSFYIITLFFCSCSKSEPKLNNVAKRTILTYMIATNSLNGCDEDDIAEMKDAVSTIDMSNYRLIIYRVSYNNPEPTLFEIKKDSKGVVTEVTLKHYGKADKQSATTHRFMEVINDMEKFAPANEYGLILWSHSNGWAITKSSSPKIRPKNFGDDRGASMPIDSLAMAIPHKLFNFIWADACYMGSIEVAYELRNCTKYFIGAPTEILADGMPYDMNIPCFFETNANLIGACNNMFNYYNSQSGIYRSATLCMIDCSKLDKVASICKDIAIDKKQISTSDLQCYNFSNNRFYFDFLDTFKQMASVEQYDKLNKAYNSALIFKAATPNFISIPIDQDKFSGLSTYIPGTSNLNNDKAYMNLQWFKYIYPFYEL